jgi:hypothetical protein
MRKKYKIKGLALPFKKANSTVMGLGISGYLYYLGFSVGEINFEIVCILLFASVILYSTLVILFGYEAIEINFEQKSWVVYTKLIGLKQEFKSNSAENLQYILLSEIAYRDDVTPLNADDVFYIVYIIFDGDRKQAVIETSSRSEAEERGKEVARLWAIEFEVAAHVD